MSDNCATFDKICRYCGAECWTDEMKTHEKCWECYVLDCRHIHVMREYQGSTENRVRFLEFCVTCESERDVFFYFDFDFDSRRSDWRNENVSGHCEKEMNR